MMTNGDTFEATVFALCLVSLVVSVALTAASVRAWVDVASHREATASERRLTRIHVRTDVAFSAMQMGMASLSAFWWQAQADAPVFTLIVRAAMALLLASSIVVNHYDRHRL
jgi:hypothetical protein